VYRPLALFALAAALTGCGPTNLEVCASFLVFAPLVYLGALGVVSLLHREWQAATPSLSLGARQHVAAVILLGGIAAGCAAEAKMDLLPYVFILYGSAVLTCWLIVSWFNVPGDWGLRWGGLVSTGVMAAPALLGLLHGAHRDDYLWAGFLLWLCTGGLGLFPMVLFFVFLIGARRAAHRAAMRRMEGLE
jgi:hypothetical protein